MQKALAIFIPTFVAIMVINQMFYGACFAAYCLAAAFPKVVVLAVIVSTFLYFVSKSEDEVNKKDQ